MTSADADLVAFLSPGRPFTLHVLPDTAEDRPMTFGRLVFADRVVDVRWTGQSGWRDRTALHGSTGRIVHFRRIPDRMSTDERRGGHLDIHVNFEMEDVVEFQLFGHAFVLDQARLALMRIGYLYSKSEIAIARARFGLDVALADIFDDLRSPEDIWQDDRIATLPADLHRPTPAEIEALEDRDRQCVLDLIHGLAALDVVSHPPDKQHPTYGMSSDRARRWCNHQRDLADRRKRRKELVEEKKAADLASLTASAPVVPRKRGARGSRA